MPETEIRALFDPDQFREAGVELVQLLSRYLAASLQGDASVLEWQPPAEAHADWQMPLPRQPALTPASLLKIIESDILPGTLRVHHPRNLGHQVAPPLPMAALCDLVAALTNQAMAVYETGPSATLIERQVLEWMSELIGWEGAQRVLTSGGAQANLTALLAARQCKAGWDVWRQGVAAGPKLRLLASERAHYSVSRAAGIMGLGSEAVIPVGTDREGRMDVTALISAWQGCRGRNERAFAVVATAGTTPTGSIDPLPQIGAFCREHGLWLHVDGAHGASALLSSRHRDALRGIELADSVVWDGHKLLYMPAMVSAVLFHNPSHSYTAFAQEASYLFHGDDHTDEAWNTSYRTLECTKRMMGLKLWAALALYGTDKMGMLVDRVFATAHLLAQKLSAAPDFELLMQPQTNIVCFRYGSADQSELRSRLVESGTFHLTQVNLDGKVWLRTTLMNPFTEERDLDALLENIRNMAV